MYRIRRVVNQRSQQIVLLCQRLFDLFEREAAMQQTERRCFRVRARTLPVYGMTA